MSVHQTKRFGRLEGLITEQIGETLLRLALEVPGEQAVVEIGSFKGMSTVYLAEGRRRRLGALVEGKSAWGKVWAVDPWTLPENVPGRHGFTDQSVRDIFAGQLAICGVDQWVVPVRGFSRDIAAQWKEWKLPQIGLLYIDGDHMEHSVLTDFRSWQPYLVHGARIVFDDYMTPRNPGVAKAVKKLSYAFSEWPPTMEAEKLALVRYRGGEV
jgi:hypothetical protein